MSLVERARRDPALALVVFAMLAAAVLYAPTLGRGMVNFDDPWLVRDNWIVRDASWSSLRAIWFDFDTTHRFVLGAEYLPIRDMSVMLDHAVWGNWLGGYHLTNVTLYIAAIPLWFGALVAFGVDRKVAALAMLLWALHPSHAESVAWLAERKGVLGIAFAGASALAYAKFRAGRSTRWLVLACTCAACAVWSKALAAFAIAALGGIELVATTPRVSWRRSLVGLGAIAVVAGLAFVPVAWTARELAVVGSSLRAPAGHVAMAAGTFGFYLRVGAGAVRDAIAYPFASAGPSVLDVALGAVGLAVCIAALVWREAKLAIASVVWLVGWFPISHLVLPLQQVVVADRYVLFPTLGLALAIAVGVGHIRRRALHIAACGVVVVAFAARALEATATWRDSASLWQSAVESDPADGDAWSMYAEAVGESGDADRAARVVADGLEHVRAPRLVLRAGIQALAAGDRPRARALFEEAANGGEPRAMTNLALVLGDTDRETALAWARRAVAANPSYANGWRILGKLALVGGRADEALVAFTRAYDLEPSVLANRFNLGLALLALHRDAEARPHLEAALADPRLADQARALLQR